MMEQQEKDRKFRELILYLSELSADDETFGAVKLNKLLFYVDFQAYADLGHSVSGQEYARRTQGPCPRRLLPVQQELVESGALTIEEVDYHGFGQKRPNALRHPDLAVFTDEERQLIEATVQQWWDVNASDISEASHQFIGWQLAAEGETIPYEVALVEAIEPTPEEVQWARDMAERRIKRAG